LVAAVAVQELHPHHLVHHLQRLQPSPPSLLTLPAADYNLNGGRLSLEAQAAMAAATGVTMLEHKRRTRRQHEISSTRRRQI
jgi:hypothetical protein